MNVGILAKSPYERLTRTVDFGPELDTGETITLDSVTAIVWPSGVDATDTIIGSIVPPFVISMTAKVQLQIIDGDPGAVYMIFIDVHSSLQEKYKATLQVNNNGLIGLTTVGNVSSWLQNQNPPSANEQAVIQWLITAAGFYWLQQTGRGSSDGTMPTVSPLVQQVEYSEIYDGNGAQRLFLKNNPIRSVTSLVVGASSVRPSTSVSVPGFVIDGSGASVALRGGIGVRPAYGFSFGQFGALRGGCAQAGFPEGIQNIAITYKAGYDDVPPDIQLAATQQVALAYKRRSWIDQKSQTMAYGAGTVTYRDWELPPEVRSVISRYTRQSIIY